MRVKIKTEILKDYLEENCYSRRGFCRKANISPETFRKLEKGEGNFNLTTLLKVAEMIGIPFSKLFS